MEGVTYLARHPTPLTSRGKAPTEDPTPSSLNIYTQEIRAVFSPNVGFLSSTDEHVLIAADRNRLESFRKETNKVIIRNMTFSRAAERATAEDPFFIVYPPESHCRFGKAFAMRIRDMAESDRYLRQCIEDGTFLSDACFIMDRYFKNDYDGTFVEIGGWDGSPGMRMTGVFAEHLGWQGTVIEATPMNFAKLMLARPCTYRVEVAAAPIWKFIPFVGFGGCCSGPTESMDSDKQIAMHGNAATPYNVSAAPMTDILLACGIRHVDVWVLDVEGAELLVLRGMDFTTIQVRAILVETSDQNDNTRGLEAILLENGYERIGRDAGFVSWHGLNSLWVNPKLLH